MLGKKKLQAKLMYNVTIDDLVPEDNIYRQIDKFLDLRFVYKECEKLYGKTGKPSIDPLVFFKLELFGYLENIISDRELIRKASDSLAARYFIGYDIDEKLPWHSTISRTRGLISKEAFENIFSKILEFCYQSGLIGGKHQSIDSTLVKANASLDSLERREPRLTIKEYINKTYETNKEQEDVDCEGKGDVEQKSSEDQKADLRIENVAKKSVKKKGGSNQDYESKTDPDSRIASKPGKLSGLYYSTHYSADSKKKVITDVYTTYADRRDSVVLPEVYERVEKRLSQLGFTIEELSADKGYCSGRNLREFERRNIRAYIPTKEYVNTSGKINSREFIFNEEKNVFICPNHKELVFSAYDKQKQRNRYRANQRNCFECPLKTKCCSRGKSRSVSQTIYYKEYQRLEQRLQTQEAKRASKIRKVVSEGLFAEAKMYNGLRKFMTKRIEKAQKRSYMIASVQNLKRLLGDMKRKVRIAAQKATDILVEPFLSYKLMFVLITKNNNGIN
jgi:transposase